MRKLLGELVAAFALFYVLSQPQDAANAVRGAAAAVGSGLEQVTRFVSALLT